MWKTLFAQLFLSWETKQTWRYSYSGGFQYILIDDNLDDTTTNSPRQHVMNNVWYFSISCPATTETIPTTTTNHPHLQPAPSLTLQHLHHLLLLLLHLHLPSPPTPPPLQWQNLLLHWLGREMLGYLDFKKWLHHDDVTPSSTARLVTTTTTTTTIFISIIHRT